MFTIVTRTKLIEQRERAAATLTRYVLARLTRSWFLLWSRPWLWQGRALLWPHSVAMRVSWSVLRVAHAGSIIFGRPVRPNSAWQHMLVGSLQRLVAAKCGLIRHRHRPVSCMCSTRARVS